MNLAMSLFRIDVIIPLDLNTKNGNAVSLSTKKMLCLYRVGMRMDLSSKLPGSRHQPRCHVFGPQASSMPLFTVHSKQTFPCHSVPCTAHQNKPAPISPARRHWIYCVCTSDLKNHRKPCDLLALLVQPHDNSDVQLNSNLLFLPLTSTPESWGQFSCYSSLGIELMNFLLTSHWTRPHCGGCWTLGQFILAQTLLGHFPTRMPTGRGCRCG